MKKSLLEIVNEVFLRKERGTISEINNETDLRNDLGMDSIDLALLTVLIEDEYGIDIFSDSISTKVGDILKKING